MEMNNPGLKENSFRILLCPGLKPQSKGAAYKWVSAEIDTIEMVNNKSTLYMKYFQMI